MYPSRDAYNRSITQMVPSDMIVIRTGTYNPMFLRPYEIQATRDSMTPLMNQIAAVGGDNITPMLLAGSAVNVIAPAAQYESLVNIPNGWDIERLRFLLTVRVTYNTGSQQIYYIQGYTDYPGIHELGGDRVTFDPNMQFIINSVNVVSMVSMPTAYDSVGLRPNHAESCHVLNDPQMNAYRDSGDKFLIRPQDVLGGIQLQYRNDYVPEQWQDTRQTVAHECQKSSRSNNIPTSYLSRTLDSFLRAQNRTGYGQSDSEVMNHARSYIIETSLINNPFIKAISEYQGISLTNRFKYGDLLKMNPYLDDRVVYSPQRDLRGSPIPLAGRTEAWTGSNYETLFATTLMHAAPALMLENLIQKMQFLSTNNFIGGIPRTTIGPVFSLVDADISANITKFIRRLEDEVLRDLTHGFQELYYLDMKVDIFGDTTIDIGLNGKPVIPFTVPMFADHNFTPVLTTQKNRVNATVQGMDNLIQEVRQLTIQEVRQLTTEAPSTFPSTIKGI